MVVKKNFKTKKSSRQFLEFFSDFLNKGQIIYLNGELGVGKTYYAKIIIKKHGIVIYIELKQWKKSMN